MLCTENDLKKSIEKLSSGLRISRGADDSSGLAISEKLRSQYSGSRVASKNILDAISLLQTAEGALQEVHSMLQRMRELTVQALNGTYTDSDREFIQMEIEELKKGIDKIALETHFNTIPLLRPQIVTETSGAGLRAFADIVFVFDTTGSMGSLIDGLKAGVLDFVEGLSGFNIDARLGLVAFGDEIRGVIDLTDDVSYFRNVIMGLSADGGGDWEENPLDAIMRALSLNYRSSAQKIFILVTDAPYHYRGDGSEISNFTLEEVIDSLRTNGIIFFSIAPHYYDSMTSSVGGTRIDIFENPNFRTVLLRIPEMLSEKLDYRVYEAPSILTIQTGPNEGTNLMIHLPDARAKALGIDGINVTNPKEANESLQKIDTAIQTISEYRAKLGAYVNRLEKSITIVLNYEENLTAAESRIRDADMAKEMMRFTKFQILAQSGMAMLVQSNALPQNVLQLLRG